MKPKRIRKEKKKFTVRVCPRLLAQANKARARTWDDEIEDALRRIVSEASRA